MLCCCELDDDVDFVSILVEIASFCVTIVCFQNGSIQTRGSNVTYVERRHKLFACNSNMDLKELKLLVCYKIEIDNT